MTNKSSKAYRNLLKTPLRPIPTILTIFLHALQEDASFTTILPYLPPYPTEAHFKDLFHAIPPASSPSNPLSSPNFAHLCHLFLRNAKTIFQRLGYLNSLIRNRLSIKSSPQMLTSSRLGPQSLQQFSSPGTVEDLWKRFLCQLHNKRSPWKLQEQIIDPTLPDWNKKGIMYLFAYILTDSYLIFLATSKEREYKVLYDVLVRPYYISEEEEKVLGRSHKGGEGVFEHTEGQAKEESIKNGGRSKKIEKKDQEGSKDEKWRVNMLIAILSFSLGSLLLLCLWFHLERLAIERQ